MSKRAVIVGWAHIAFGKLDEPDVESSDRPRPDRGAGPRARLRHRTSTSFPLASSTTA